MTNQLISCSGKRSRILFIALTLVLFCFSDLLAQRPSPGFGIGFQVGNPTGLSMQFYKERGMTTDILVAYNLKDFFFLNIHGLWNVHLDQAERFHFYYGPGGFVGIRSHKPENRKDDVEAGISGNFGLNYVVKRIEFFGQATPRLALTPGTNFNMGGGVGMRFFF